MNGNDCLVNLNFFPPADERPQASKTPIPIYTVATPINQNIILLLIF